MTARFAMVFMPNLKGMIKLIPSVFFFKDEDTDAFDSYFYLVCDNKAELVDFKMNSLDIQLQAVFEKVTGIYLSH